LFDEALRHLEPKEPAQGTAPSQDGFLYSGNRHESVPRALFLDRRLTPLERNAWQVFRLQLNDDGVTAFPTYDQLRPYLASMPCAAQASHETVARALTLLRLTRWLSLVRRRRDPKTGRIQGNLYVLHDEPLSPFEAMQLDPDYLGLVSQALTHAAKAVQVVGMNTLRGDRRRPAAQRPHAADPPAGAGAAHGAAWLDDARLSTGGCGPRIRRRPGSPASEWLRARLRNPKQGRNPRRTALFGFRRRTVQYVMIV
jgi:hypothetical protein